MILKNLLFATCMAPLSILAQVPKDSAKIIVLKEVNIQGIKTIRGTGHMPEVKDVIIYAGKKNEVILVDSLDANKAINNTRQILGRIPGLNIVETETGGFTANGIATRGLNPTHKRNSSRFVSCKNVAGETGRHGGSSNFSPLNL